ncbi:MAG TPA: class I SAM-dependent methyltransferase [Nitrososphaeraceae archaeon]|jgi:cyclopropane fatty-acyl-phospholipid synthase-like methyltransferase
MKEPDFGTYHHSTAADSKKIRAIMKAAFTDAFASLPLSRDDKLKILDVGCGLGFLSCVSAEFYKNASIIGIDTFKHASLKQSSPERAKENARMLDFSGRIKFRNKDVFRFTTNKKFDIIVSNLLFHNLGKMRYEAYTSLSSWTRNNSFIIIGDLFFSPKKDIDYLSKIFRILREFKPPSGIRRYSLYVMSKSSAPGYR